MDYILDLVRKPDYHSYGTPEWAFDITASCPACGAELARVEAGGEAALGDEDLHHECSTASAPAESPATA